MLAARTGRARFALSAVVGTALACAIFGTAAESAFAAAGSYTVNITPASALPGASTAFTVAIANTSSGATPLGSAVLIVPSGFKISTVSLPAGAGSSDVVSNTILLGHLSVAPGSTLNATVTATSPSHCNGTYKWLSQASQGDPWSAHLTLSAAASNLTVTTSSCALQFGTQPNNTVVNQSIRGAADNPAGPPVTVEVVNSAGTVVNTAVPVTMAVANNPGGATLGGSLTRTSSHGVATFSNLKLNQPGVGYTLAASSPGMTGITSSSFNETQTASTTCTSNSCQTTLTTSASSLSVAVTQSAGTLTESVDQGNPLDCSDRPHGAYTGFDPNWYGFSITGTSDKGLRYALNQTVTPRVCFGATADFPTNTGLAPAGTLPDGTSGFIGLLPNCATPPTGDPCILSIGPGPNGTGTVAQIDVPQAFAGDPFGHM